jgi:polysaccharide deacetylase 2 family uncharacterized protein YibQ
MTDDLDAPLGVEPKPEPKKRWLPPLLPVAAGLVGALVLAFVGAVAVVHNPLGGEPLAIAAIATAEARTAEPTAPQAVPVAPARNEMPAEGGQTINIIDGMSGNARAVRIAVPPGEERASGLDPRMIERGPHGPLPRIAPDGRKPHEAYARAFRLAGADQAGLPRVAVLVGGLGISQRTTAEALAKLPGAVSFAFAPYGADLERLAARARSDGHEVFLQVPMEPLDYPENDPGPQTLLTSLTSDRNIERLHWSMGRFQGYAGIVNYMGGKFTATENALLPVLRETHRRGLMVVDDGSSARSLVVQLAGTLQQPVVRGDILLDRVPTPAEVDAQLARLEERARETGFALGIGSALPVTIDRLARWARTLEARGIILVPVTAGIARRPQSG